MRIGFVTSHYENLGIEYLCSYIKKHGFNDLKLYFEPALFHNFFLDKNYLYENFFNFKKEILEKIKKDSPDIVAFSVISDNYAWSLEMAKKIKEIKKDTVIVFGGIHPSSVPEYVIKDGYCDFAIIGEGEEAFLELLTHLKENKDPHQIKNLAFRDLKGEIRINKPRELISNLDTLPFPDKEIFYKECKIAIQNSYTIIGSRGCMFNCSYCWNSSIKKIYPHNFFRRRSIPNIIEELEYAKNKYGIKRVTFYDEVFSADKKWLFDFASEYKKKINLPYFCCVHPYHIDEDTVKALEDSGCGAVNIGIQTTSSKLWKILNRNQNIDKIKNALSVLRKSKIYVYSNYMIGLPNQSVSDLEKDFIFSANYKSDMPAIYWLRYYPNTEILKTALKLNILNKDQIKEINESKKYLPYAITGNTFNKNYSKIANLILLSGYIPKSFADIAVKYKIYKLMPSKNLLFPAIAIMGYLSLLKGKKHNFHYLSITDYIKIYIKYIFKKNKR